MTPLVLIVGFLGAGKTTFLKRILPMLSERGLRPRVIINDYQNAGVDADQIRGLTDDVRAIAGDCVCCGSREELVGVLSGNRPGPGEVVLVETNGTTDSEALIEMLSLEASLTDYALPLQVSLIDAKRWQKRFWHNALEREQARTATHVVISRTDTETPVRLAEVDASFAKHHIHGRRVTLDELAGELATLSVELSETPARDVGLVADHQEHSRPEEHGHGHHHFASLELRLPATVIRKSLVEFLKSLPEEVLRAKGIARLEEGGMFIFQKVDRFDEPQFFPLGGEEGTLRAPLVLFIGPCLNEDGLSAAVEGLKGEALSRAPL